MSPSGICYLVGAGPGDPDLITVKGRECIRRADVIYYDHLAAAALLAEARADCEKIYVGKEAGDHAVKQDDICELLCATVRAGKAVVRLKGGDPFVFGRGGEEALALAEAGLPFEIVPGVTAGIAGAAYAGIPLTHRKTAVAVTFVTGHEDPTKPESQIRWAELARGGQTLCFYMGTGNLASICERLVQGGRSAAEPVAVIQWATTPRHRTVTGTLTDIAARVEAADLGPPAVIVIGPVVGLREKLAWFERRPLLGKRVLVTRSRLQASELAALLRRRGAEALELPTIRIESCPAIYPRELPQRLRKDPAAAGKLLADCDPLTRALVEQKIGSSYDWVVFTSINGVTETWKRLAELGLDSRTFGGANGAAMGAATAASLAGRGIDPEVAPEQFVAEALFEALSERLGKNLSGSRFLLLRADIARPSLRDLLAGRGAAVDDVTAYHTRPTAACPPAVRDDFVNGKIDAVTFASASTARNFAALLGADLAAMIDGSARPLFFSIGPVTSAALRELDLPVDAEAEPHTIPALVACLEGRAWATT